jgi:hypothetical protein
LTVIAFDGRILAADGRATRDGGTTLCSDNYKKLHTIMVPRLGKCVVGLCGALDALGPYLQHLRENGLTPMEYFTPDSSSEDALYMRGLLITPKGECYEISSEGGWHIVQGAVAIGSGSMIAGHYLAKGCDAVTAVAETCKTELTCGGTITTWDSKTNTFSEIGP